MCLLVCKVAGAVSVPPKEWEEVKWQANCTDRIRHNRATVVATGFELGCAAVPKKYLSLNGRCLDSYLKGTKPLHAVLFTTDCLFNSFHPRVSDVGKQFLTCK